MDFTDGSKEAKLLQELIHLIEEAAFRRTGTAEGFMAEVIQKEMRKKGFNERDFASVTINPKYEDQYRRALTAANVPYMQAPDVHGNLILIIRSQDKQAMLDIDAAIKKGSTDYTRTQYVESFLQNEEKLGNQIFRLKLSDIEAHQMIANKAFEHTSGFVSSFKDNYMYFSETASNSDIATILLDTKISSNQEILLGKVKEMNRVHEKVNLDTLKQMLENGHTGNFVNRYDNHSNYLHVENNQVTVHTFVDKIDTPIRTINFKDFENNEEALEDELGQLLAEIYNCEQMDDDELATHIKKSSDQLNAEHETELLRDAKVLYEMQQEPHPRDFANNYLAMDKKSLDQMKSVLKDKIKTATDNKTKKMYKEYLGAVDQLSAQKAEQKKMLSHVNQYVKQRTSDAMMPQYKFLSPEEKLSTKLSLAEEAIRNSKDPAVIKFMESLSGEQYMTKKRDAAGQPVLDAEGKEIMEVNTKFVSYRNTFATEYAQTFNCVKATSYEEYKTEQLAKTQSQSQTQTQTVSPAGPAVPPR